MKINKLLLLTLFLSFSNCLDLRTCNKSLTGKYISQDKSIDESYLILNTDGTFFHYCKNEIIEFSISGTWEKSKKGYCYIELSEWKAFNESTQKIVEYGNKILFISNEYLDHSPDGTGQTSFKRLKE